MPDVEKKSRILTIYERSIFAKVGASVSSLKEQQIPTADTPKPSKKMDLVKLNSDFMKIVVEPYKTALYLSGVWGNIIVNPTESLLNLLNIIHEPAPITLDNSDKLLKSKVAITEPLAPIDLLKSPMAIPDVLQQIDLTKSPLAQLLNPTNTDLLNSPMDTPGIQKPIDLTTSPMKTPGVEKSIDLLKSPLAVPGVISEPDLLKSPMVTPSIIKFTDLLSSPMDVVGKEKVIDLLKSPMDTPGKEKISDLIMSTMETPGIMKVVDLLKSPMQFPVGTIVTETLLASPIKNPLPFTTRPLLIEYGMPGTQWSDLKQVDFFDKPKMYATGFTNFSAIEYSEFMNNKKTLGIVIPGHEPVTNLNTPWSILGQVDSFVTNATPEYSNFMNNNSKLGIIISGKEPNANFGTVWSDINNQQGIKFGTNAQLRDSYFIDSDNVRIDTPLNFISTKAAYEHVSTPIPSYSIPFSTLETIKNSEFTYINNSQIAQKLGRIGESHGVKPGYITGIGIPPQGQVNSSDTLFHWSQIRATSSAGIPSSEGNIDMFNPKSPFTEYKKDSDFYTLYQNSLVRMNRSNGLIGSPAKSFDGKTILPSVDSENLYNELYGFNLDSRLGVLNQYKHWSGIYSKLSLKNLFKEFIPLQALDVAVTPGIGIFASSADPAQLDPSSGQLLSQRLYTFYTPKVNADDIINSTPVGFGRKTPNLLDLAGRALSGILQEGLDLAGSFEDVLLASLEATAYRTIASAMGVKSRDIDSALRTSFPMQMLSGPMFAAEKHLPATTTTYEDVKNVSSTNLPSDAGNFTSGVLKQVGSITSTSTKVLGNLTQTFGVNSDAIVKQTINKIQSGVSGLIANTVNSLLGKTLLDADKVLMIQQILEGTKYTAGRAFYDPLVIYYNSYSDNNSDYAFNRYDADNSYGVSGDRDIKSATVLQTLQAIYSSLDNQSKNSKTSILGTVKPAGSADSIPLKTLGNQDIPTSTAIVAGDSINVKWGTFIAQENVSSKLFKTGHSHYLFTSQSMQINYSGVDTKKNKNNIKQFEASSPLAMIDPAQQKGFSNDGLPFNSADAGDVFVRGRHDVVPAPDDTYSSMLHDAVQVLTNGTKTIEDRGFQSIASDFVDVKNAMDLAMYDKKQKFNDFDLIDFYFEDISSRPNGMDNVILIPFRAILTSFNDNTSANWSEINYVGRPDKFWIYQGFIRTVDLTFDIAVESKAELLPIWRKLNYLSGMCYPVNFPNEVTMTGPIVQVTVGSLLQRVPAFLNSFTFSLDNMTIWELEKNYQLPMFIKVTLDMTILFTDVPLASKKHFAQASKWITPVVYQANLADIKDSNSTDFAYKKAGKGKKIMYVSGSISVA